MKKGAAPKQKAGMGDELRPEYRFDYGKAKPNRYAERTGEGGVVVVLEEDIAKVFRTPESVKTVLRALIATMPSKAVPKANSKRAKA